jgi:hypothetical protein
MTATRAQFISAGFVVSKRIRRSEHLSAELLPGSVISASSCLTRFIPDTWAIAWTGDTPEQRREDAAHFGVTGAALDALTGWVTERVDTEIGWPNVCLQWDTVVELVSRFLTGCEGAVVLELGLHESDVERFREAAEPPPPEPGYAPMGRHGALQAICAKNRVRASGRPLGFEPLAFNHGLSCSWLCNGLETTLCAALGIRPNPSGLIEDFSDARRGVAHIARPEVGAEPGLWLPWLLLDHTESARSGAVSRGPSRN